MAASSNSLPAFFIAAAPRPIAPAIALIAASTAGSPTSAARPFASATFIISPYMSALAFHARPYAESAARPCAAAAHSDAAPAAAHTGAVRSPCLPSLAPPAMPTRPYAPSLCVGGWPFHDRLAPLLALAASPLAVHNAKPPTCVRCDGRQAGYRLQFHASEDPAPPPSNAHRSPLRPAPARRDASRVCV